MKTWEFSAVDTLFFKEARPMEAPGSSELGSVFPPPIRSVAGAIRTHIGETKEVNWETYKENEALRKIIGYGDEDYANMRFNGIWLHYKKQRFYPAPLNLIVKYGEGKQSNKIEKISFLEVGEACECDLGKNVRLAGLANDIKGSKSLSNYWINAKGLQAVMAGKLPELVDILPAHTFFKEENRLGIARDNKKRVVKDGMLYQTRHLRLNKETRISVDVSGLDDDLTEGIIKLGGEGRMAAINVIDKKIDFPTKPTNTTDAIGIIIYLLTPMILPEGSTFLPGFKEIEEEGITVWKGELNHIPLRLISSVMGKVHREGGWDIAAHQPIAVKSMIPAGSVFYCEAPTQDLGNILDSLNNTQMGKQQHLGRGHIAIGLWIAANQTEGQTS